HPHRGFEIISYVLEGEIGHRDTLGTVSRVKTGGAQVMQTGSGVSHQEETLGDHTEFFQIWFEPDLQEAVKRSPTYREFHQRDFPVDTYEGVTTKSVIGDGGPISLVAPVTMQEIRVLEEKQLIRKLQKGNCLAALVIDGEGSWTSNEANKSLSVRTGDLAVIEAAVNSELVLRSEGTNPLRTAIVEVPVSVPYRLYA
ncbi:MAG: pirin family protein, partial [Nitrospirota bacterium]